MKPSPENEIIKSCDHWQEWGLKKLCKSQGTYVEEADGKVWESFICKKCKNQFGHPIDDPYAKHWGVWKPQPKGVKREQLRHGEPDLRSDRRPPGPPGVGIPLGGGRSTEPD